MMLHIHAIIFVFSTLVAVSFQSCKLESSTLFAWPTTEANHEAISPCPNRVGNASRLCTAHSSWSDVDATTCSHPELELLKLNISDPEWEVSLSFLHRVINVTSTFKSSGELLTGVDLVTKSLSSDGFFENSSMTKTNLDALFKSVDLFLQNKTKEWWLNIHKFNDSEKCLKFLNDLKRFGSEVTLFLSKLQPSDFKSLVFTQFDYLKVRYEVLQTEEYNINLSLPDISATIPSSALKYADGYNHYGFALLQFSNSIGSLLPPSNILPSNNVSSSNIHSAFVSFSVFPTQSHNALYTVSLPMQETDDRFSCSFLNDTNFESLWNIGGCEVISSINNNVTCNCSHPSVFIAITPPPSRFMPSAVFAGLVLTEILIWSTILMLLFANRRLESDRAIAVKCFLLTISATHITLLNGLYVTENEGRCRAVALMLHFFELSEAFWLLGMAVQLALKVAYKTTDSGSTAQFMALGWITPLFVVASSAGLSVHNYGTPIYCFLNVDQEVFYAFAVPAALIIVTAFFCLVYAAFTYAGTKKSNRKVHRRLQILFPNIRATLVACITLTLDWTMTILELLFYTPVTNAFFALLKIIEALFIFFLYGVFSSEVQIEYEKRYGPCWPNRRKKGEDESPRPGTNDELSQIRESSVIHDLDSSISVAGPLAAYAKAQTSSASNGGYGYSNSTSSLRKNEVYPANNANGGHGGTINPFIVKGNDNFTERNGGVSSVAHSDSGASTSSLRNESSKKESALPVESKPFRGLHLKHKLKVFPMKHDQLREEPSP